MSDLCLLVLVAPPPLEEPLVDFLLEYEGFSGFSTYKADGSPAHGILTLAEQVTGRKRQVMFQVHAGCTEVHELVAKLGETFHGVGLHDWITPLIDAGPIP